MTVNFIPYAPEHLLLLDVPPAQQAKIDHAMASGRARLAANSYAWTGIADGRVIGCGGLITQDPHRALAWVTLGIVPRRAWVAIVRKIAVVLATGPRRIEAAVKDGFENGCRLVDLLGFTREGVMHGWGADGSDFVLFARVQP